MAVQQEEVILVNDSDEVLGVMEKLAAHKEAKLHRAFSVFVFNKENKLLMQKRAAGKYHSPGLWTNTCCSHPRPGERTEEAASRRLKEEMGFVCELTHQFSFIYKADMSNGLTEHEFDHVYFGNYDGNPNVNSEEVCEWKYISLDDLSIDINQNQGNYTAWFKLIFPRIFNHQ